MGKGGEAGFALEVIPVLDGGDLLRVTLLPCLHMDLVSGRVAVFAGRMRNLAKPSGLGEFDVSRQRLLVKSEDGSGFSLSLPGGVKRGNMRKQTLQAAGVKDRDRLGERDVATEEGHRSDELKVGVRHGCCACTAHGP